MRLRQARCRRSRNGSPHAYRCHALATSLVADLQLITAALVWVYAVHVSSEGYTSAAATIMVSMSGGALLANLVSVLLLVVGTVSFARRYPELRPPLATNPHLDVQRKLLKRQLHAKLKMVAGRNLITERRISEMRRACDAASSSRIARPPRRSCTVAE
jgi:hypothetical protein